MQIKPLRVYLLILFGLLLYITKLYENGFIDSFTHSLVHFSSTFPLGAVVGTGSTSLSLITDFSSPRGSPDLPNFPNHESPGSASGLPSTGETDKRTLKVSEL